MPAVSALILLLVAAASSAAWAQTPGPGRITGRISDVSGGALPGVKVTLLSDDVTRSTVSDPDGRFAFEDVTPDATFMLRAELPGFLTATRPGLVVSANATGVVDISLKIGCLDTGHGPELPPLEQLMSADGVIHLRIANDSQDIRIETEHECLQYQASDGAIVGVGSSRREDFRPGAIIQLSSDGPLRAGAEYIAFVRYNERLGRFWLST